MSVYQKLNAARKEFHTLQLKKTGLNKFAGYYYFELSDFLIPALEVFDKHGLCAFISFGQALATLKVVDVDDGSFIELTSPMAEAQLKGCHPIQNLGAVETYTRRYLWVAALEIVEHDALDSSKPLDKPVVKQGALQGIGDDLSEDWKTYLQDTAKLVSEMVTKGDMDAANFEMHREPLDDTQQLYMERFLDSKVRSALRKFNATKKEA
jgi:hypothetical protein